MSAAHLPPEALLEHAAWLRRLAAGLVRGDGDADDLVQETWLAALRSPPRDDGPARGWLGEVLRNARRMRARSDGRRARRESELGTLDDPAAPSPETLLARLEVQRHLAALVAELAEPFRSTVLLRYFEGLSAADIARRQGVPAGTVRWRLKEGLERLRVVLDRENGGDRKRWGVLLAPLAAPRGVSWMTIGKGILIMSNATKVGAGVAAVAVLVAALGWRARTTAATAGAPVTQSVHEDRDAPAAAPTPTASASARQARDEMRSQILEALRKRDAGAPPPPRPKTEAHRPEAAPAEPTRGTYDRSYIQEHFREDMIPLLRSCYEDSLRTQPKLAGKLVLTFSIVGDPSVGGVVEDADFAQDSDIQDDDMRTCVRESLMTLTFDKPPTGGGYVTVTYPMAFAPGPEEEDGGATRDQ